MRLTTRTNLALRTLMFCAVNADRVVRKQEVALACNASENHLAQVINKLAQTGFITTVRGRHGGFHLAGPTNKVGVGAVFRAFEAGVPFIECFSDTENTCPLAPACRLRDALARAVEAFYATLDPVTLADLVDCNGDLNALLLLDAASPAKRISCGRVASEAAGIPD